jgi:hypothetical protein
MWEILIFLKWFLLLKIQIYSKNHTWANGTSHIIIIIKQFLNSHLFWLNSHPFFHPKREGTQVWGLWSIRAQLTNLPAEVIELNKEHTFKV